MKELLNLPPCKWRLYQRLDMKSVYCKWHERGWVSVKLCDNCIVADKSP